MIKAIITDLDGTLLPGGRHQLSPENTEALITAEESGWVRIVATGRSPFSFRRILQDDLPIDYLIFSSGAGAMRWEDKSLLFRLHLNSAEIREIFTFLSGFHINFTVQKEIPDNHLFYYTRFPGANDDFIRRIEHYPGYNTPIEGVEEIPGEATQFLMILPKEQLPLFDEIKQGLPGYSVIRSTSPIDHESIWVEIFSRQVNKGNGCELLFEQLGLSWSETAGLGNDYNDIDFLERTHRPYVVENAPEALKSRFGIVSSDHKDGFSEFIRIHLPYNMKK